MAEMNERQRMFADEYIRTWNGVQSYLAIYPDSSYDAAMADASKLLRSSKVRAYIRSRLEGTEMSADEVKIRMAELARDADKNIRLKALIQAGKIHGLFQDRVDLTTKGDKISWKDFISGTGE